MDSALTDQNLDNKNKYKLAGYCAIICSILYLPWLVIVLTSVVRLDLKTMLLPFDISLSMIISLCGIYILYSFKSYLNEYYQFHDIDIYVMPLVILSFMTGTTAFISRMHSDSNLPILIATLALCFASGIISIIFCVKLMNLSVSLYGMLKPYVYLSIAAAICFMLFFLGPIAVILLAVADFILGLILLKPKEEIQVEFV
jgi:hypothetical protein